MNYLFLGDYIDRGLWSVETILLLLLLKVRLRLIHCQSHFANRSFQLKFPDNFLLLRGNHETVIVNRIYGFYEDLIRRFGTPRLFNSFQVTMLDQAPVRG